MTKRIVLTGGGTAGHVTPNLALIPTLQANGWDVTYFGSIGGVEEKMIKPLHIPYHAIRTGKLRRYFSWQNLIDPFNVFIGVIQAYFLLRKLKAQVVFSKGGFVALPVVIAAFLNRIPVVIHESDMTPGLANRLSFPFATVICLTFAVTKQSIKKRQQRMIVTGTPIREQLFSGDKSKGLQQCAFSKELPCLLVIGGGQGSTVINQCIRDALGALCKRYQVIHLCGPGKIDPLLSKQKNYYQAEYANETLPDLFAASDLVISRAGANSLYELLALQKPHILIPLSRKASRGDQIHNAQYFKEQGISVVIQEERLSVELLLETIKDVEKQRDDLIKKMANLQVVSATEQILALLGRVSGCELMSECDEKK